MSLYTDKTEKDLNKLLADEQTALRKFCFGVSGSSVRNVKEGRARRKTIARIKTELQLRKKSIQR